MRAVLESAVNVSEGRDPRALRALAAACGTSLLDLHVDTDHHRSVLTLAGDGVSEAVRSLGLEVSKQVDLRGHVGVHPRLGALDVVPFVALDDTTNEDAVDAAREFAGWVADTLAVPVFLYDRADPTNRSLPETRRDAFVRRAPRPGFTSETVGRVDGGTSACDCSSKVPPREGRFEPDELLLFELVVVDEGTESRCLLCMNAPDVDDDVITMTNPRGDLAVQSFG